jgi:hypothetical protein
MGFVVPGRCPGLSHYAPLGRNTGAALEAIKLRDRNHRLATRGYVGWNRTAIPRGGLQPQRGVR